MKKAFNSIIFFFPFFLYLLAVHPYIAPLQFDNIVYIFGAKSLATTGSYQILGDHITDWPWGFSFALAIPIVLGWTSVLGAKFVLLAFVFVGFILIHKLLQSEKRTLPLLAFFLFAITPTAFLLGTRVVSEWPYLTLSIAVLLLLPRLKSEKNAIIFAVMAGIALGYASIIRYVGICLGAAIICQAIQKIFTQSEENWFKRILPEIITSVIGSLFMIHWLVRSYGHLNAGTGHNAYHADGEFLNYFNPVDLFTRFHDLFFHSSIFDRFSHLPFYGIFQGLLLIVSAITVLGFIARLFEKNSRPSDWYVLAYLTLIVFTEWKVTRYLLPVAPFLFDYLLNGVDIISKKVLPRMKDFWGNIVVKLFILVWVFELLAFDFLLLTVGNMNTHKGLNYLRSPTGESFYAGEWKEIYQGGDWIAKNSAPGAATNYPGGNIKYTLAFSGRETIMPERISEATFVLVESPEGLPVELQQKYGFKKKASFGKVSVYQR